MIPVILSGGSGSRLWPLSRKQFPKQFLALTGEHTLFQQTLERLVFEGMDTPIVVCNKEHRFIVNEQLSARNLDTQRILMEPFGRNTAPAVALTAMMLVNEGRDELMLVLPADHVLEDQKALQRALALATVAAENGEMVLFGVPATKPETGYGYIKSTNDSLLPEGISRVSQFVEKPDVKRATEFVQSGGYFWNSGMFLFRASRFLEELKKHDPDIYDTCVLTLERSEQDADTVDIDSATFACCPDNSIDYSVMEKTQRACVVPLTAGWSDVGCWSSLWEVNEKDANGNVTKGDVVIQDSKNCMIHGNGKLVSVIGLENIVVVETKDAMMIAHKDKVQGVKQMVNTLNEQGRSETQTHCEVYRPWGSYDSVDMGGRFQVKRISVKPGACLSLQMHHHRAEHWIVVSGTAEVTCDENVFLLTENQSTYIPIASVHRLRNPGKISLEIIEVQSGSYLGEDDIERFEDIYGRSNPIERGVSVKTIAQ
ncbi:MULTISPECIES: mannose-1-phosphate guanylyltransferase/mannose-6-phosphate isomerase [unclassified Pseudomonas]|jgi:mannose-1-phosphate guanylyltransferase/mannose-6-phosphate isomerase|uniref:mannose-1-phosphate guanylyltransferase/mannose-6-phosphate isomerase n=1 Tax=unclassified Pseudomonas TaxID=196821 RepID=UPI0013919567|nr:MULTISPECIES: mannose-1-phosphate guanylyltransferase/mannose-6-phosphate isomerase [unclassified Pseudomonas]KAI2690716.1 mannose-1-phosphate guanylyltransferase/mannose-6-phosphate isomerase [Pseudomonas sp. TNT3]MBF4556531.1 mannose-1-phosphate guanylyltransferase/mannose-6-phosphate isomerase [Pseudomonas sp. p50(2008)]MBH1968182.1 mannose-1-phosphate guanylyltransferase/mannose-6-phosphate isomerase [Pseudomonadales bacterium]MBH2079687.1 mannose-1-phosphate guanylyltransferase/mannose-